MTDTQTQDWHWWAGRDDEWFTIGPEATRDDVIAVAIADESFLDTGEDGQPMHSFFIAEAMNPPLRLSAWCLSGADLLEWAEDQLSDSDRRGAENDDETCFEATRDQIADLTATIRAAVDAWQDKHSLSFTVRTLAAQRNAEFVNIDAKGKAS